MLIIPALLALSLTVTQGPTPQGPITVDGKEIPLRLMAGKAIAPPDGFVTWKGLDYLGETPGVLYRPYVSILDWTPMGKLHAATKLDRAVPWRAKIVVLARAETLGKNEQGLLVNNRDGFTDVQIQSVLESIVRASAAIEAEHGGLIDFQPDVVVDREAARDSVEGGFGPAFAESYFAPQINGGSYEADDKVFRGPYNSVFYITPGPPLKGESATVVNGTPIIRISGAMDTVTLPSLPPTTTGVPASGQPIAPEGSWQFAPGIIEEQLRVGFDDAAAWRLASQGVIPTGFGNDAAVTIAVQTQEPGTDQLLQRLTEKTALSIPVAADFKMDLFRDWIAPNSEASLVDDTAQGQVLRFNQKTASGGGGIALPNLDGKPIAQLDQTGTLTFQARTTSKNPISVRLDDDGGQSAWVSLGRDTLTVMPSGSVVEASFVRDGQWHSVAVDLKPLAQRLKLGPIVGLRIEPSPNALSGDTSELGSSEYFFTHFKFSSDAGQPLVEPMAAAFDSPDPIGRALAASQATAPSLELMALLKDPSTLVRLNAVDAYTRFTDPMAEVALTDLTGDLSFPVQERAIIALGKLNTPTAITKIRNIIKFSLSEPARAMAAHVLAETKDVKYSGDMVALFSSPGAGLNRGTKIAALDALAMIPGSDPRLRVPLLRYEDPAVRLRSIQLADIKNDEYMSHVLWYAVNDPYDLVRAGSDEKLLSSNDPKMVTEGLKGVRDDSVYVRKIVLDYLKDHPMESAKGALLLGVSDSTPSVRAKALDALAASAGPVTSDDVANVLGDKSPVVQLALLKLSKAKGISLPESTIELMKSSPDPAVAKAAAG